jgi:DNA-binding TFAR19-related protein (PDSD5 family)
MRIIEDMIANMKKEGKIVHGVDENEYVKLIEKMREMKKEETKRDATVDEIEKAMKDFVKE